MIVLLIISIFVVLFYILHILSKGKESFKNKNEDIILTYTLNNKIDGPIAYIKNISTFSNGFYEQMNHDNPEVEDCRNDEECGLNGICLNRGGVNRCNKIINKEAFRFIPDKKSHITIPNINPNNLNLNFIIMANNVNISSPLISTSNNSWGLGIEDKKFVVYIVQDNNLKKYFSQNELKNHKIYEIILRVYNDTLNISLDKRIITVPIDKRVCLDDSDCGKNGFCERSSTGSNYCSYNRIQLNLGRNKDAYFDGFIGDIYLNFDKNEDKVLSCDFNSKEFKNRRICQEECLRQETCDKASCERICSNVQKCEFEPSGRHSEDCIQLCKMNDDCDNQHCNDKCRNCGKACPWNNLDSSDRYDSDYYDKKGRPSPPRVSIMTISSDGRKALLRWKAPFEGMGRIEGYISYLYKTFNKSEGVKINNIPARCSDFCEYVLDGLNPSETYTLGIKGYNYLGLGKMSNLLTFKPDKKSINQDFSIVPNVDESIIGEFNYCNVEDEE